MVCMCSILWVNIHSKYTKTGNSIQTCTSAADNRILPTAAKEKLRIVFVCDDLLLALSSYYFIAMLYTRKRLLEKKATYSEHTFSQQAHSVNIYANIE